MFASYMYPTAAEVAIRELVRLRRQDRAPLARHLDLLRWLVDLRPVGTLAGLTESDDPELLAITMFLLRRCRLPIGEVLSYADREVFAAYVEQRPLPGYRSWAPAWVVQLAQADDAVLARQAVRLLRFWNCREVLTRIMLDLDDERLQRLAQFGPQVPFRKRLSRFLGDCQPMDVQHQPQSWFAAESLGPGRPLRSPKWIRRILEHIRFLVRGIPSGSRQG